MFTLLTTDGRARRGIYKTPHGDIQTPVFMNVATQAAIKGGLSAFDLKEAGCQAVLCNTYHLHLRPGEDAVRALGGLHGFMNWHSPMLTDSGGFQVFSLAALRRVTEEGVAFSSHIDGRRLFLRPEDSIAVQHALGADIIMAFDECVENPSTREYIKISCGRTARWLRRCHREWLRGLEERFSAHHALLLKPLGNLQEVEAFRDRDRHRGCIYMAAMIIVIDIAGPGDWVKYPARS